MTVYSNIFSNIFFIDAAIKNIRECMLRKSAFTQVSLYSFKKKEKESYDAIVKVLKIEVNDLNKLVDEILSLAGNSKSENVKKYLDEVNHKLKALIFDSTIATHTTHLKKDTAQGRNTRIGHSI